jgi:hypothetical protein
MAGLIIEGVTGAGKSELISAMQRNAGLVDLLGSGRIFTEEETFGEFMTEMHEPNRLDTELCRRLAAVIEDLKTGRKAYGPDYAFILERFHLSYYALLPDWELYRGFDQTVGRMTCKTVLLTYPDSHAQVRALYRPDRRGTRWTAEMLQTYKTPEGVAEAIALSQRRRREALKLSLLPSMELDTARMNWDDLANQVLAFWRTGLAIA